MRYAWILFHVLTFSAYIPAEITLPLFTWGPSCDGYDYCGTIEFCSGGPTAYGYKQPGSVDCASPGPLIRLEKGKRYKITLRNTALPATVTNLHTHGLHISGSGNSDDVTRVVSTGNCLSYAWELSRDHAGGTHWYHAHHHGSTQSQVSGGAYGVVIVEEDPSALFPSALGAVEHVHSWLSNEKILILGSVGGSWKANGEPFEQLNFISGQWYRLRVALSDPEARVRTLQISASGDEAQSPCEIRLVAHDGVFRSRVPSEPIQAYSLTGASRVDLAVKCTGAGRSALLSYAGTKLAFFNVTSGPATRASPFDLQGNSWAPVRPYYLKDLTSAEVDNHYSVRLSSSQVNGKHWDPNVPLTDIPFDTVQEWNLLSAYSHPFHMHLYHVQVVSPSGCGSHEYGEWYDTVGADCTVRFRAADIGERCILHCHVLAHEDMGAMGWVNVTGSPKQPTTNPEVAEYECPP